MVLVTGSSATLIRTVAAALGILCVCWFNLATAQQAYYIHTDHLDTPRTITNGAGQVVWTWSNDDPFGYNAPNENPTGLGNFTCNLRFPGQYFDKETNVHYNYFRDYDPAIARYIESDPSGLAGGTNTYAYVDGNPISYTDPLGLQGNNKSDTKAQQTSSTPPQTTIPPRVTTGGPVQAGSSYDVCVSNAASAGGVAGTCVGGLAGGLPGAIGGLIAGAATGRAIIGPLICAPDSLR
jgi:RHS repeat-associated protein